MVSVLRGDKGNSLSEEAEIAKERRGNNSFLKPPPRGMATRWTDRGTCPQAAGEKTNTRKKKVLLRAGGPPDHETGPRNETTHSGKEAAEVPE